MITKALAINPTARKIQDRDNRMVSGRWSDRVEHPTAFPLVTARVDARCGADSVLHLAASHFPSHFPSLPSPSLTFPSPSPFLSLPIPISLSLFRSRGDRL